MTDSTVNLPALPPAGCGTGFAAAGTAADGAPGAGGPANGSSELARMEDRYKRALADLDNYRKRSARELPRVQRAAASRSCSSGWRSSTSVERARESPRDLVRRTGGEHLLEQMESVLGATA